MSRKTGIFILANDLVLLAILLACIGCQKAPSKSDKEETSKTNENATQDASSVEASKATRLLRKMFSVYRSTSSYSDEAIIQLNYRRDTEKVKEATEFKTRFVRPNKLRLKISREDSAIAIVSDGKILSAQIIDPKSDNFAGQIAQQATPQELDLEHLYSITEYSDITQPEAMTSVLFGLPIQLDFSQVALLLSKKSFDEVFRKDAKSELLASAKVGGEPCFRVRVADANNGYPLVFWINQKDSRLHRLEFPTEGLRQQLQSDDVTLTAEFRNVRLGQPIAENEFRHPRFEDGKLVRYFVKPPTPLPSDQMGKEIGPFSFLTLENQTEDSTFLISKHVVLIWFDRHEPSKFVLKELENVKSKYASKSNRIAFRAICAEPTSDFDNRAVRQLFGKHRISIPAARDNRAVGRDRFGIRQAPSIVILGKNRRIHLVEVGANPRVAETVDLVLQSLLQGVDVGGEAVQAFRREVAAFQRKLASVTIAPTNTESHVKDRMIADATSPEKLIMQQIWHQKELNAPGNLLALRQDGRTSIYTVNALQEIVELDANGRIVSRQSVTLADADAIAMLKSFVQKEGQRIFLAFSRLGKCVYVLDANLKPILRYPKDDQPHPGIQDAMFADLDRDGKTEIYVAFTDPIGLHRIDLDGTRVWSSRSITGIQSLVIDRSQFGRLMTTGQSGLVKPVFVNGHPEKPIAIGERSVHALIGSVGKNRPTGYLGWTSTIDGRLLAIGLNRKLEEQWSYGLPNGVFRSQVQYATNAKIFSEAYHWLLAGPDGSIHVISDDGNFFDSFNFGKHVDGLVGIDTSSGPNLVIASSEGVRAFRISKRVK